MEVAPRWITPPAVGHCSAKHLISAIRSCLISASMARERSMSMSRAFDSSSATCAAVVRPYPISTRARLTQSERQSSRLCTSLQTRRISSVPYRQE